MSPRKRKQLIAALLIAPLLIVLPVLWPQFGEAGFLARNLDILLIFVAVPFAAALWLHLRSAGSKLR